MTHSKKKLRITKKNKGCSRNSRMGRYKFALSLIELCDEFDVMRDKIKYSPATNESYDGERVNTHFLDEHPQYLTF